MLKSLTNQITGVVQSIRGIQYFTEDTLAEPLKKIQLALLDSDVHYDVAKSFTEKVKKNCLNQKVTSGLTPEEHFLKILKDQLIDTLGQNKKIDFEKNELIIFNVGLQGMGKTTTTAKLAHWIQTKKNRKVGLISVDVHRPAAREQLKILAETLNIPCFIGTEKQKAVEILKNAKEWFYNEGLEVAIIDTAGRSQMDKELIKELEKLQKTWVPDETFLVMDSSVGQQAVAIASEFQNKFLTTGFIMTKLDGDAKGGALLSVKETTSIPICFVGTGEKIEDFSYFYPDRMASRILDQGDIESLVEKAESVLSEKEAEEQFQDIIEKGLTLKDFLKIMKMTNKMGGMGKMLSFIPQGGQLLDHIEKNNFKSEEKKMTAMIQSMTHQEQNNHHVLNYSRMKRVAKGSGTHVSDIKKMIRKMEQSEKVFQLLQNKNMSQMMGMIKDKIK